MSGDWKPGTVAVATVRGVEGVRVMRVKAKYSPGTEWAVVQDGAACLAQGHEVTDVRPLVVLDLDQAPFGTNTYYDQWLLNSADIDEREGCSSNQRPAFLRWIAEQIATQTKPKPPRIPEPGQWGVVEAGTEASPIHRRTFVRDGSGWVSTQTVSPTHSWDELIDPTLIREGVQP